MYSTNHFKAELTFIYAYVIASFTFVSISNNTDITVIIYMLL